MATLVAFGYPDQTTAEQALETVRHLEGELIIQADKVAAISRDQNGELHVYSGHGASSTTGVAAIGGFWGLMFGLLFFIPFAGLAIGAGSERYSDTSARTRSTKTSSTKCAITSSPAPRRRSW